MVSFCPSTCSAYSRGTCIKKASDIEADKPIFRLGVDILQSVYKFSGVLNSVGVLPLSGVRILANSLARRYVRKPNGSNNGSQRHSFFVYFRESIRTFVEDPSTSGGADHIACYQLICLGGWLTGDWQSSSQTAGWGLG